MSRLKGVPFHYLVPDSELLPVESIRFFQLDRLWVESLLDGALSIGRVTSSDHALDREILREELALTTSLISGFVLRSEAVAGWPDLRIGGYNTLPDNNEGPLPGAARIPLVRQDTLSDNVLLCLFDGDLQTLDLHLMPEALHFGVNANEAGTGYERELRDTTGVENGDYTIDVPLAANRVLQLDQLLANIQATFTADREIAWSDNPTSANLALQLLEGVENVRFIRGAGVGS